MAKSVFTKNKLKGFFIFLSIFAILSVGVAVGVYLYFGHSVEGQGLTDGFDGKLKLGSSFTVDNVIEHEKYNYAWLASDNVMVNVYATDNEGGSAVTTEVLDYDDGSRTFAVVGTASGYIEFIYKLDSTIRFSVSYTSSFVSNDTTVILSENYPNIVEDGVVTSSELDSVEVLTLQDKVSVDLADFSHFSNLKKLEIKNDNSAELVEFSNFYLPAETHIYVSVAKYLEYTQRTETDWVAYRNRIYPASGFEQHSIVLYKNGGSLVDDNGLEFKAIAVGDEAILDFSTDYVITKVGYQFAGWFLSPDGETLEGEAITGEYLCTEDVKLAAKWEPNTYTVRMYHNDETSDYTDKLFIYDVESPIADILPQYPGFIHLGWAADSEATSVDYREQQLVKNLTAINHDIIEVYAIWAHSTLELQYYSWDTNQEYQKYGTAKKCTYGDSIVLDDAGGPPSSPYGSFKGWALNSDAVKPDYNYGDKIEINVDGVFLTSKVENVLEIYGIFELESYDIIYDAAGGSPEPADMHNIARGVSVNLNGPIEKEGYKFMGWEDTAGYVWTCEDLYQENQSFFNSNFTNRLIIVDLTEYGFVAEAGINTISTTQVTLTAVWKANTFRIFFNGEDATSIFDPARATYGVDCSFSGDTFRTGWSYSVMNSDVGNVQLTGRTLLAEQIRTLYLTLKGDANNNDFDENSSVTFTPDWSVNSYTVSFDSDGGSEVSPKTVTYGETYGDLSTPTKGDVDGDGGHWSYSFSHWALNGVKVTSSTVVSTASDHTLKAVWESTWHKNPCLASGSYIQMADGSQKKIEDVSVGDFVLTWDFETGTYASSMVVVIEHDETDVFEVVDLCFDDGVIVSLITEHGFFDATLNKFVYITPDNAKDYIGHTFIKMDYVGEELVYAEVALVSVNIENRVTGTHSLVTAKHLSHFANGYLTIAAGIDGLFNIFDVNDNMQYDAEQMQADIQKYGTYSYDVFQEYVSYEEYIAFNGAYLKVAVGKGLTTFDEIINMINRYLR